MAPFATPSAQSCPAHTGMSRWQMVGNARGMPTQPAQISSRIAVTDTPVIAYTRRAMALRPDTVSMAQGIVHWGPPPDAIQHVQNLLAMDSSIHGYAPNEGLPALRQALRDKIQHRNGLHGYNVCVTAGANQAFMNCVLTLCDEGDKVVLFRPYYFDHLMTLQQTGGATRVVFGEVDALSHHPSLAWLREQVQGADPPRMVVLCNPCNPTGVLLPGGHITAISELCASCGAWLVLDNTYEDFLWTQSAQHHCAVGPHVVNLFSFSKAYGMMGWRVGYIAYPDLDGQDTLGREFLKCQDTICICAPQLSQHLALQALQTGGAYLATQLESLKGNRAALLDALSPLSALGVGSVIGGEGAIYLWAKLPAAWNDDERAVEHLVVTAGVCVVPGSAFGAPGWFRVSFGNLPPDQYAVAAVRLKAGLTEMVSGKSEATE